MSADFEFSKMKQPLTPHPTVRDCEYNIAAKKSIDFWCQIPKRRRHMHKLEKQLILAIFSVSCMNELLIENDSCDT